MNNERIRLRNRERKCTANILSGKMIVACVFISKTRSGRQAAKFSKLEEWLLKITAVQTVEKCLNYRSNPLPFP